MEYWDNDYWNNDENIGSNDEDTSDAELDMIDYYDPQEV